MCDVTTKPFPSASILTGTVDIWVAVATLYELFFFFTITALTYSLFRVMRERNLHFATHVVIRNGLIQ